MGTTLGSLMAELEAREAAAHARAEALRARIAVLTEQLTAEEELLSRLGITRQTVLEVLGGRDEHGSGALEGADGGPGGVELDGDAAVGAALRIDGPIARAGLGTAPAAVRVGAVTVPEWQAGVEEAVLPVAYRDVLEVLADAGQPLRAQQRRRTALEAQAPGAARLAGRAGSGPVRPPHPTGRVRIDRPGSHR